MALKIRPAGSADADAIAALHLDVWRRTYRDLAPPAAYAALDLATRQAAWRAILALPKPDSVTLVAENHDTIAGFAHGGPPADSVYGDRGEVKYLYVAAEFARQGIGRMLLATLAGRLADLGYQGIALGVVEGNEPALAFYRALGARVVGRYADPGPLWRSDNHLCAWDDARALARQA